MQAPGGLQVCPGASLGLAEDRRIPARVKQTCGQTCGESESFSGEKFMDMHDQTTMFDACQTTAAIQEQLQRLARTLLATLEPSDRLAPVSEPQAQIDLKVLSDFSYADLKHQSRPMFLLSEICRLLLKSGHPASLSSCLRMSHKIHEFRCQRNESWYISSLYKGIAQVGLGMTDIGTKNILLGMGVQTDFTLFAIDQTLGYWALTSAAIAQRNLKLAQTFAGRWRQAAQSGALEHEMFRADIVALLLHLVYGDQASCRHSLAQLSDCFSPEWRAAGQFLTDWAEALISGDCPPDVRFCEPYPLLLGVQWRWTETPTSTPGNGTISEFEEICQIRRAYCHQSVRQTLSTSELEAYAGLMAQWELPRPLWEFQDTLKHRNVDLYHQTTMTRFLGEPVLKKILSETPMSPEVMTPDDAFILVMDVRKYSALSEQRTAGEMFDLLNPVFKIMNEELEQAGGTILEFVGDCIIVVFNTFETRRAGIDAIVRHTIRCIERIHTLNALSQYIGLPEIHIGVGLHHGPVALGNLGGLRRCHLTVLGNTVNLAARIESASKDLPGTILVSEPCFGQTRPDFWKRPDSTNWTLRDVGCHTMRNIQEPVHLFSLSPLLRFWVDFVPMGFLARPEPGVVYLDSGNAMVPGILDHRTERANAQSACELLLRRPDLLLEHVRETPASHLEFRFHDPPDLDCAAAFYAACELMDAHPRMAILEQLAAYLNLVNYARIPSPNHLADSLYGMYKAHTKLIAQRHGDAVSSATILEAGVRVIDAAVFLMEEQGAGGDFASIFQRRPGWFADEKRLIRRDQEQYRHDVETRCHTYAARVNGMAAPVTGLWLDHPQSLLFRIWAWNDPEAPGGRGYHFIGIDFSEPEKRRFVIGVNPESGANLRGLGQVLEAHEAAKRKQLGQERPSHAVGYAVDAPDPWYFGQGHNYTVIDSPDQGTILTAEEVRDIHARWPGWPAGPNS